MKRVPFLLAACLLTALASCSNGPEGLPLASGDNGTLDVGDIGTSLRVVSDNATRDLEGSHGRWSLPPG